MTEKLFSFNFSDPKYQKLDEEETIESFRMHDFSSKTYSNDCLPDDFKISPSAAESDSGPFEWKSFVPYQLKREKAALFPEFYFHFKKSFSNASDEKKAYVLADSETFKSLYPGNETESNTAVEKVEKDFDLQFRQCLDSDFSQNFSNWTFTRACVETTFRDEIKQYTDRTSYPKRMDELIQQARAKPYDIMPLVDFLMAYGYPEESIWFHVVMVYGRYFDTKKRQEFLDEKLGKWQQENIPFPDQIQGFVQDLKEKGMIRSITREVFDSFICLLIVLFIYFVAVRFFDSPASH